MGLAVWRDISLLWLIFLTLVAILPFGVLFYYCIKGLRRLRQLALIYLPIAQVKAREVADVSEQVSLKLSSPIIGAKARAAQARGISDAILMRRKQA
ncbi:hypothetical protein ACFLWA_01725 [Chloroflexota bacterium]